MKIINKGYFYAPNEIDSSGTAYHGIIQLSQKEFDKAIKTFLTKEKELIDTGSISYSNTSLFKEDIKRYFVTSTRSKLYALRITYSYLISKMFKNTSSRYKYKNQNYLIEVK